MVRSMNRINRFLYCDNDTYRSSNELKMSFNCHPVRLGLCLLLFAAFAGGIQLQGQGKANVTVETSKLKAMVYATSIGVAIDRWDLKPYDAATLQLMREGGFSLLRLPGNGGVDALYHWSTGTLTNPYTNDRVAPFTAEKMFPAVVPVMDKVGTALVSVNYGSNADGSGGGEPAEAAAWVAYANGSASNPQAIGNDSKGVDWKTVGFWATLRSGSPIEKDDGYNHLRIGHADPLGIALWTIGNEPFNDGFYYQERTAGNDADNTGQYGQSPSPEPDLHAGKVGSSKDWGRHVDNGKVGPQAYGAAVVLFAKAMKAVDPTIMVGAFLMMPPLTTGPNQYGKNWNAAVLKAACAAMDFSAVTFWEGQGAEPTFVDWVDEDELLLHGRYMGDPNNHYPNQNALSRDFSFLAQDMGEKYKKFCPAGHAPQMAVTNFGLPMWLPSKNPAAIGMYAADSVATLLETGVYTVIWSPLHGPVGSTSPSILDSKDAPQPGYYGIKFLHQVAGQGDQFVTASTSLQTLSVHAVKRRDGGFGLILINKDINRSVAVTVSIDSNAYAKSGTRYDWGKGQFDAGKQITETPIDKLGATFTVEVPRYAMTAILIPKAN